jgi:hypothetical protein
MLAKLAKASRLVHAAGVLALVGLCATAIYQHSRGNAVADIYRQRLQDLSGKYQDLRQQYNQVVRQTAVTELVQEKGRLNVVVRTAEGVLQTIPTRLDPKREIHVEYVIQNGRLWIRRAYSLSDPDGHGEARADVRLINPLLADLPWATDPDLQGLEVFRGDLSEGRWVVTATGNGALALTKLKPGEPARLSGPPAVGAYPELQREVQSEIDKLSVVEIAQRMLSGS